MLSALIVLIVGTVIGTIILLTTLAYLNGRFPSSSLSIRTYYPGVFLAVFLSFSIVAMAGPGSGLKDPPIFLIILPSAVLVPVALGYTIYMGRQKPSQKQL